MENIGCFDAVSRVLNFIRVILTCDEMVKREGKVRMLEEKNCFICCSPLFEFEYVFVPYNLTDKQITEDTGIPNPREILN